MFFIDGHNDTMLRIWQSGDSLYNRGGHINIKKLKRFDNPALFFAIFLEGKDLESPYESALAMIRLLKAQIAQNSAHIAFAANYDEMEQNRAKGLISAFLALEGAEPIERDLGNIQKLYDEGVRYMTLTWSRRNNLGVGVSYEAEPFEGGQGLTPFGKEAVREMNRIGMMADVSHLTEEGFWDVCRESQKPFIATHSNCKAVCSHNRNLNDEQMKEIAKRGGLMGICFYDWFLRKDERSKLSDVLKHIDYALNLIGDDFIALGGDLDGTSQICADIGDVTGYTKLHEALTERYGEQTTEKIFSGNYIRLLKK